MRTLYTKLINHDSYVPFNELILPKGICWEEILNSFMFLSPIVIIFYGSTISKKRYSPHGKSDLDVICVTTKSAFWNLNHLYEQFRQITKHIDIEIDLSILTCNELYFALKGNSSIGTSLNDGFTLLWMD